MLPVNRDLTWKLLALEGGASAVGAMSSAEVATSAVKIWDKLAQQFAQLVGDTGIWTLFDRSLVVSSASFPCLATARGAAAAAGARWSGSALHDCLARQDAAQAVEAFEGLLATTVELLGRFVGDRLVLGVLHEVWPEVFSLLKEPP